MFEKCKICGKDIVHDVKALNQKVCGRQINEFFCIDCLAKEFKTTKNYLLSFIEFYKEQGCTLFSCKK